MNVSFQSKCMIAFTCALVAFFSLWPMVDLQIAHYFYHPGVGFFVNYVWWVKLVHAIVAKLWLLALVWLFLLILGFVPGFKQRWASRQKMIAYLLAVLIVGPGLIVHEGLKDNWGRARPIQLAQFGGEAQFTPALMPSKQCHHNCSFVSGHAAIGFYPMVGYWITRRRRWLLGGTALGLLVGYVRMVMGGHFLSDILFAGVIVYFTCCVLAYLFHLPNTHTQRSEGKLVEV